VYETSVRRKVFMFLSILSPVFLKSKHNSFVFAISHNLLCLKIFLYCVHFSFIPTIDGKYCFTKFQICFNDKYPLYNLIYFTSPLTTCCLWITRCDSTCVHVPALRKQRLWPCRIPFLQKSRPNFYMLADKAHLPLWIFLCVVFI